MPAIGSLEPGKLADLVVIGGDLASVAADEISSLDIWMTLLGGEVAFAREPDVIS